MGENLTPKQRLAIAALIEHGSVKGAAGAAGVSRETLYRWQKQPTFAEALRDAESAALAGFTRNLLGLGELASQALRDGLAEGEDIRIRLRAADILYSRLLAWRELVDLERRLAALESRYNEP